MRNAYILHLTYPLHTHGHTLTSPTPTRALDCKLCLCVSVCVHNRNILLCTLCAFDTMYSTTQPNIVYSVYNEQNKYKSPKFVLYCTLYNRIKYKKILSTKYLVQKIGATTLKIYFIKKNMFADV